MKSSQINTKPQKQLNKKEQKKQKQSFKHNENQDEINEKIELEKD